jgi:radical SAM protein with 4Fe4S-binding SPASM domain
MATDLYTEMAVIPKECQDCKWLNLCGAGCAYERLMGSGSFREVSFDCEIKRPLFEHIEKSIGHLI